MAAKKIIKTMLSLKRFIEITNGSLFEVTKDGEERDLSIARKSMRVTNSARPKKDEEPKATPNIQESDYASLSTDSTVLGMSFAMKFIRQAEPEMISPIENTADSFYPKINNLLDADEQNDVIQALKFNAYAYAYNIAIGKFAWRNADLSVDTTIKVSAKSYPELLTEESSTVELEFKSVNFSKNKVFNLVDGHISKNEIIDVEKNIANIDSLTDLIYDALLGNTVLCLDVTGLFDLGMKSAEVFPSQLLKKGVTESGHDISKLLFDINGVASVTSQKIGNALRTYDSFHSGPTSKELAVEPLGVDLGNNIAQRNEFKMSEEINFEETEKYSFYKFMDMITETDVEELASGAMATHDWVYVLGNVMRGGVFGNHEKEV